MTGVTSSPVPPPGAPGATTDGVAPVPPAVVDLRRARERVGAGAPGRAGGSGQTGQHRRVGADGTAGSTAVGASLAAAAPSLRSLPRRAPAPRVMTVLVACQGERWLPRTLAALAEQTRPSDLVVTVDAGSTDDSEALMRAAAPDGATAAGTWAHLRVGRGAGLLDAAAAALALDDDRHLDRAAAAPDGAPPDVPRPGEAPDGQGWVWLLHDDSAPAPDVLGRLLDAVEVAPAVAVVGAKLTDWDDPGRLQQVGLTTSRRGRRLDGLERGERDQGQRDGATDVLAVSTAGMLVRRDVLATLGPDAVPATGAELDLCQRARLAGHRVVVVPGAVLAHADATATGRRDTPAARRGARWSARRDEVHRRLVAAPLLALPLVAALAVLGAVVRALGRVAVKQPSRAPAELTAVAAALSGLLRPGRLWRARRTWRTGARVRPAALGTLRPGPSELLRWHRDRLAHRGRARGAALASADVRDGGSQRSGAGHDEAPMLEPPSRVGRLAVPAVLLVLGAAGVLALRPLLRPGQVTGPALAGEPSASALVRALLSDWSPGGLGAPLPADPLLWVVGVASLPAGGSVTTAVALVLVLALPLAGWGAWAAAGLATRSRPLRLLAALAWAGAPPLLAGLDAARVGAVLAHLALPWALLGTARALGAPTRRAALTAAAAGGLAACVAVAAAPVLVPALLLAVAAAAVLARRRRRAPLLWVLVPALVLVGPLLLVAAGDLRALVVDPGLASAHPASPAWALALGQPSAGGGWVAALLPGGVAGAASSAGALAATAPGVLGELGARAVPAAVRALALTLPLVLPALALAATAATALGVRTSRTGTGARAAWWLAGLGLATAAVSAHTSVAPPTTSAWPGAGTSLLLLGTGAGALLAGERVRVAVVHPARAATATSRRVGRSRWRAPATVLVVVLAVLPLGALAGWVASPPDQVRRAPTALPAVAADAGASPDAVRTLVLDLRGLGEGGSATATISRGPLTLLDTSAAATAAGLRGPLLGPVEATATETGAGAGAAPATSGTSLLRSVTASLAAGSGDPRPALLSLGVGYVFVRGDSPLDGVETLVRAASTDDGVLYRVATASPTAVDRPARARLLGADGSALAVLPSSGERVVATVPPGPPGRQVVLAERADPGWRASYDGAPLAVTSAQGWATGVAVPARGGELVIDHAGPRPLLWAGAQGLVLLLTVLLAVPIPGSGPYRTYRGPERRRR